MFLLAIIKLCKGGDTRNPSYRQLTHGSRDLQFREACTLTKRSARLAETGQKITHFGEHLHIFFWSDLRISVFHARTL